MINYETYAIYAKEYVRGRLISSKCVQSWDYKPMPFEVCLVVSLDANAREIDVMLTLESQQAITETELLIGRQYKRNAPKTRVEYELLWEFYG